MNNTIVSAIEAALSEVIERPLSGITADMKLDRDFDLDSFMFVQFLLSLEDKVPNLRFDPTALGQTDFNSVGSLAAYISAQVYAEAE
ncbi:acyl carrier protein [Rhizobium mongolense subsp. loessense]|uniref:Acyl carrier protein n=1 Tax=Rhizobium mongolense subsp. loessense TaxID=158890 RepID=A0A1G4U7D1_9HYPH|nr:phosphopantetheine-binding protein [Rhizobium mongolense]SCW88865.1 acyl carrier protein [Rhizobium mongolense subsp. loessense]